MAGRIDQVKHMLLALEGELHLDRVTLDRDTALTFQVHVVENLRLQILFGDGLGELQESIRQGALTVVDMGDDAKIADVLHARSDSGPEVHFVHYQQFRTISKFQPPESRAGCKSRQIRGGRDGGWCFGMGDW